jgi:hypothetical protein
MVEKGGQPMAKKKSILGTIYDHELKQAVKDPAFKDPFARINIKPKSASNPRALMYQRAMEISKKNNKTK